MVKEKVVEIIKSTLSVESIKETNDLVEDLGADSLDIVEIIMRLEEEYNITITDAEAETLKTVADVVTFVEGKVK